MAFVKEQLQAFPEVSPRSVHDQEGWGRQRGDQQVITLKLGMCLLGGGLLSEQCSLTCVKWI